MANGTSNDIFSALFGPNLNTIGAIGGNPITLAGQPLISQLLSGGLDIYSLLSGQDRRNANTAINIADPLLPLQGTAQSQMADFLKDPSSVLKDPAFLAAENLGAENISRQEGARGMASSGNRLADLFTFGQTAGLGYENQRFNQLLALLHGSPDAANISLGGQNNQNRTIADLIASLFGGGGVPGIINQAPNLLKLLGLGGGGGSYGMNDRGIGSGDSGFNPGFDPSPIAPIEQPPDFPPMDPFDPSSLFAGG